MAEEEDERDARFSTLKFPFLPLPPPTMLSPEHPSGMATPPLHTIASVPFKWEEQPGKPRPCTDIVLRPESARCLELPPCRMTYMEPAQRITKITSPTTVLDGPYIVGRPKFSSFRLFREARGSFDSSSSGGSPQSSVEFLLGKKKTTTFFGRSFKLRGGGGGGFGFSPLSSAGSEKCSRVKMEGKKLRRNGSLSRPPSTHLWASVRESLKKAIPWKSSRKSNKGRV